MTRDEIEKMPAGREMDVLIAKHVMGLTVTSSEEMAYRRTEYGYSDLHRIDARKYSEDISAAWLVVEKLAKEPCAWYIHSINLTTGLRYNADYWEETDSPDGKIISYNATAETAPLAICRAALMAVMK